MFALRPPKKKQRTIAALLYNNLGSGRNIFDQAGFVAQLTNSLVLSRGTGTPTFTRATTGTVSDNEGRLQTAIAGEARFVGARRVRNLITGSSWDMTSGSWTKDAGVTPTAGFTDPDGGLLASKLVMVGAAKRCYNSAASGSTTLYTGFEYFWLKGDVGGEQVQIGDQSNLYTVTLTTSWAQYQTTVRSIASGFPQVRSISAGTTTIYVAKVQREDITGRTDQTTPSEYVSVGVLSTPWHGAGVDSLRYFDTDLTGAALPTSYTYDAVTLNGVAGTYVSTPNATANQITGDIDIRCKVSMGDWTPDTEAKSFVEKRANVGQRAYGLGVAQTSGYLRFVWSPDGTAQTIALSTVAPTVANGSTLWVRVAFDVDNGAAGNTATFYTSSDGNSWTQLGAPVVTAGVASIHNSTDTVNLGTNTGAAQLFPGKIYQAQIYNGINGTLAVDFDASRYAGGTTLTGSTGETWTLQGNAKIHPTNYPNLGFLSEAAATNLCLQSNAFTTTWSEIGSAAATQNAIGPDGATSAWTLTDNDAGALESKYQAITLTAAVHTVSIFVKKTTGAQASYPAMYITDSVNAIAAAVIDTSNGVATIFTAYTGFANPQGTATCVSYNADYWRVSITFTASAVPWTFLFAPAGTTNPSQSTGSFSTAVTGSAVFYGAQVELGSVATSYIPTTTIAVARNGDIDSLPTAGNILAAAGTIALTYTPTSAPSGTRFLWGTYVDASNYTAILHDATNLIFRKRIAGVNTDATIANAFVSGTTYKMCASWGAAGQTIYLNGTAGTPHANTTAAQIAATMQVGADGNSLQQPAASIKNGFIWNRALSGSEQAAITT